MSSGTAAIVIFVLVALVLGVFGFSIVSSQQKRRATVTTQTLNLANYADQSDIELSFTIMGPVVSDEFYRSGSITVSPSARTIAAYKNYTNTLVDSKTYANNPEAFRQFANALQISGFTKQRKIITQKEVKSTCPTGFRYIYELREGEKVLLQSWATSCGTSNQSFIGSVSLTNQLFRYQIPSITQMPDYKLLLQ